ncbi:unnamed protein product, partial [Mesorhabditis belari]|uniref:DNA topoisomerase n=1 Tax=Mesorhabditis belari TaxID=2138241 RepID=A0AAF3EZP6_9BILA
MPEIDVEKKMRRTSYEKANDPTLMVDVCPIPARGINAKLFAEDGCYLLDCQEKNDKICEQFAFFDKLSDKKSAPATLVSAVWMLQAVIAQLFLNYWQRDLCFERFFHVYRHSKITDIDVFDEARDHAAKRNSRRFRIVETYVLLTGFTYAMASFFRWTDQMMSHHYLYLRASSSEEMSEELQLLIGVHTGLNKSVRSVDEIFKIYAFLMIATVIPTTLLTLVMVLTRNSSMGVFLSIPCVAFCIYSYYGTMITPARLHEELNKSKSTLCMNNHVWVPYDKKVNKMTVTVLMVAEKPMLADSIAQILSNGKASKRKGWNNVCSVSEYSGRFQNQDARIKVTSTCGHVMSVDFPPKFNNWDRTDPADLYSAPIQKNEANPAMKMPNYLASEAKGVDYLVLWLDCDKEGENICFEVIDAVKSNMKVNGRGDVMDNVYRAHFSAITDKDIKAAMNNLGRPDLNQSLSVDARQELDLRIGCSFTRFQTKYFHGKYGDLDSSCISFGPCQTPTLAFCVTRHDQITQFKPEQYWVLQTAFLPLNGSGDIRPEWNRGRIFDREVAQLFCERVKKTGKAIVIEISKKESRKEKPQALNTVELLRVASSALGMGPSHTMSTAEHLYTQGYISYPRTETTSYPTNFDLKGPLSQQSGDSKWGAVVARILNEGIKRPRGGDDKGDHPPITPMRPRGNLSGDMLRIYEYITQHFIATLMGPCIYEVTTIKLAVGKEEFQLVGRTTVDPGFSEVMAWLSVDDEDSRAPNLKKGDTLELKDAQLVARETSPPSYLTESELITLMEKHGIGTDASIPVHINTICQRNYVTVESGRRLIPTPLGISLIHGYWKIDSELVLPTMRSEVEKQLTLIAKGEADYYAVKNHALEMFRQKFVFFVQNIATVDTLFEASFTTLAAAGKPFSKCGKCRRYMKLVESRPIRLYCPNCQETYNLPSFKDGQIRLHGDKKCPLDDFDLVYWQGSGGKLARSFALCPCCYNEPPFPEMGQGKGCDHCPHPSCTNSFMTQGVCGCVQENCNGVLMLDPQSHPKWRLQCNKCPSVVGLFDSASKVRVTEKECDGCSAQMLNVEYNKEKSPLPDGATTWTGCPFCEESVKSLINLNHAYITSDQQQRLSTTRGRGGRGRGRGGRGGRGGGRGARGGTTRGRGR